MFGMSVVMSDGAVILEGDVICAALIEPGPV